MKTRNMKARLIALAASTIMASGLITGCAGTPAANEPAAPAETETESVPADEPSTEEVETEEPATDEPATDEPQTGMANPWVEITEEEAKELCPRLFKVPIGATSVVWQKCETPGDQDDPLGALVELDFKLDAMDCTARAQYGADEDADISGMYYDWTAGPDDVTLANWGEGNMKGQTFRSIDDQGYADLITWYDIEIGIKYSLSVTANDLDGFDIQALAEQMYNAENEPN